MSLNVKEILESVAPLLMSGAGTLADTVVNGANLSNDQVKAYYSAYCELCIWGESYANSTETPLDDQGVETAKKHCLDTLNEAKAAGKEIPFIQVV